jgi:methylated-DNA-[protein]-cysteine S-methyltransferase
MTSPSTSLFIARTSNSPIGCIETQSGNEGLYSVNLYGSKPPLQFDEMRPGSGNPAGTALDEILGYLSGSRREFSVSADWAYITSFQAEVLRVALAIPFGSIRTYGEIARQLGKPAASRAVGGALAHNPIPVIIPCHRVVAADGSLTGFSAADGIRAKQWLLELEGHTIVGEKLV